MKIEINDDKEQTTFGELPALPIEPEETNFIVGFFKTLKALLLSPTKYFEKNADRLAMKGGLAQALAFALVVDWLGSVANFIWKSIAGVFFEKHIADLFRIASDVMDQDESLKSLDSIKAQMTEFLFGAGTIVLSPFFTLFKLTVGALFVHLAVKFFFAETPDRKQSYQTTLKILAYAMAPVVLSVIPGVGFVLSLIFSFVVAVAGLRTVYQTTSTRATIAVVFPQLLMIAALFAFLFVLLFFGFYAYQLVT